MASALGGELQVANSCQEMKNLLQDEAPTSVAQSREVNSTYMYI